MVPAQFTVSVKVVIPINSFVLVFNFTLGLLGEKPILRHLLLSICHKYMYLPIHPEGPHICINPALIMNT